MQPIQDLRVKNEILEERVRSLTRQVLRLASTLTVAEQEERHRIAQILHDDLQQQLYSIQRKIDATRKDALAGQQEHLLEHIAEIEEQLNTTITVTRQLTTHLSPNILKSKGLNDLLFWLQTWMEEQHGLKVDVQAKPPIEIPNEDLRILLFQTIRELLFNVVKHAQDNHATIEVENLDDYLVIRVIDRGRGFNAEMVKAQDEHQEGFGLFSARERLAHFGGHMTIDSKREKGTQVTVHIPLTLGERHGE